MGTYIDETLRSRILQSREAALAWLLEMSLEPARDQSLSADSSQDNGSPDRSSSGQFRGAGSRGFRFSHVHDPERWPGMILPATYNAASCLALLDAESGVRGYDKAGIAGFIEDFQKEDGVFRLPGLDYADCYKRNDPAATREYIDFHATNYSLGALELMDSESRKPLRFMDGLLTRQGLNAWIERRSWDDPWLEGNSAVNLGSFYHIISGDRDPERAQNARLRLHELLDWLDSIQDPDTGFWGESFGTRTALLHGFAGAMHSFHLYYLTGRPLLHAGKIASACISLAENELDGATTACLDVDIVDVLANLHRLGIEREKIESILARKLDHLLLFQSADGGFADRILPETDCQSGADPLRFDGWVRGYSEPQGNSNCFGTWFRCIAIAMIDRTLPGGRTIPWRFRKTAGIGYFPAPHG